MAQRLELQQKLTDLLERPNVYFQPGPNIQMKYPAFVYKFDGYETKHADNLPYNVEKRYEITHIDPSPTSSVPDKLAHLPKCRFVRSFAADGLNHNIFTLYF